MNLFYISPAQDFLPSLINGISEKFPDETLANLTILLPSQRACTRLIDLFLAQSDIPVLLPRILPIGDAEEDEVYSGKSFDNFVLSAIQSFTATEELSLLCSLFEDVPILKAIDIAQSLRRLLIRLHKDNVSISALSQLTFGDTPQHIIMLMKYLYLLGKKWPTIVKQQNKFNFVERRNLQVNKLLEEWLQEPPIYPVIAAGSSGSIKSTAKLLKTLASLSNGYVILRGFSHDNFLEEQQVLDGYHPFFYLTNLINEIGINSTQIKSWTMGQVPTNARHKFLYEMMRTSLTVSKWQEMNAEHLKDLGNFKFIECQTQHEEVKVIGLKIREALAENKTIAVISNDSELSLRLQNMLQLWDIVINNSHGMMLINTQQISFLKLIVEFVNNFSALNLLSLLKHEFFSLGQEKSAILKITYILELKYMRGVCNFRTLSELIELVKNNDNNQIVRLLHDLNNLLKPLSTELQQINFTFYDVLLAHIKVAEELAANNMVSGIKTLWDNDVGRVVGQCLNEIITYGNNKKKINSEEYWRLLSRLIGEKKFYFNVSSNASIVILSAIESRLLHFDVVILSGLNEGMWPESISVDPWLNTSLSNELGLTPEEYKIGLSALDFYCLAHTSEVLLTRSIKNRGALTISSRWIIRMEVLLSKLGQLQNVKPITHKLQYWAEQLFLPNEYNSYQPAMPKPLENFRPKEISITQIEKLMRDPYGYYAAKILKIRPLDPIDKEPDQRDFGNFVHVVVDAFNKQCHQLIPEQYLCKLLSLAQHNINHIINRPIVAHIWLPRFTEIAKWLVEFENIRRDSSTKKIYSEVKGRFILNTRSGPIILTAKADRVECNKGLVTIMDFKTGMQPLSIDILTGHSPQLTLEALIAEQGGFRDALPDDHFQAFIVQELIYAQLASGIRLGKLSSIKHDLTKLIQAAKDGVKKLVEIYLDENTIYVICPSFEHKPTYNEYEHLERIDEWV